MGHQEIPPEVLGELGINTGTAGKDRGRAETDAQRKGGAQEQDALLDGIFDPAPSDNGRAAQIGERRNENAPVEKTEDRKNEIRPAVRTFVNAGPSPAPGTRTIVNAPPSAAPAHKTMVNESARKDDSEQRENRILPASGDVIELQPGDKLSNEDRTAVYTVVRRLGDAQDSGEADIFQCERAGQYYVAKLFRRSVRIDPDKIEKLKAINSSLIARILDIGSYAGYHFEIYQYYNAGSLADDIRAQRRFTYDELRRIIIPSLNEALNTLHKAGIHHRDVKPGNILWSDSTKTNIVLIDFGLSSVAQNGSMSVVVSRVGFSIYYAPPEILRNVYVEVSDYYSMGVILYELFTGKLPNNGVDAITRPSNMPEDLYRLIRGLTYATLENRHDENNPNRRWGYDEICAWLQGKFLPIPGTVSAGDPTIESQNSRALPQFGFAEHTYSDIDSLCKAMAITWDRGKRLIMRGTLEEHLNYQRKNPNHILWRSQIQDIVSNADYTPDQKLLRVIQIICPERDYFACPFGCFTIDEYKSAVNALNGFGKRLMTALDSNSPKVQESAVDSVRLLLGTRELSQFMVSNRVEARETDFIKSMENDYTTRWAEHGTEAAYILAYAFSGEQKLTVFCPEEKSFSSIDEVKTYLARCEAEDFRDLYRACEGFLLSSHQMKPKVYGWLFINGCDVSGFNLNNGR